MTRPDEDPLAPARGIFLGLAIAAVLWSLAALTVAGIVADVITVGQAVFVFVGMFAALAVVIFAVDRGKRKQ